MKQKSASKVVLNESQGNSPQVEVIEKRTYYHSQESEERPKENILAIPEQRQDDWEEVRASRLSNPNNKIGFVQGYLVPKDTRRTRGTRGGLLNLSEPESLKSFDQVRTEETANLVQPLVWYYDSFPGIKNYETEIAPESETETELQTDIMITEKKSAVPMDTARMRGYTYENGKRPPKLFHQKIGGYVYQSVKKGEPQPARSRRSFDTGDYYFYKNEYYRKPSEKEIDLRNEPMKGFMYENRKKEIQLKSHRMLNYTYTGPTQNEVDWEVEKRRLKRERRLTSQAGLRREKQGEQHAELPGLQTPRGRWADQRKVQVPRTSTRKRKGCASAEESWKPKSGT